MLGEDDARYSTKLKNSNYVGIDEHFPRQCARAPNL
jgi:hypothetical protein